MGKNDDPAGANTVRPVRQSSINKPIARFTQILRSLSNDWRTGSTPLTPTRLSDPNQIIRTRNQTPHFSKADRNAEGPIFAKSNDRPGSASFNASKNAFTPPAGLVG